MKDLRSLLSDCGYSDVRTYIQSGNCVFRADEKAAGKIGSTVKRAIGQTAGFEPDVYVLRGRDIHHLLKTNPFGTEEPKKVHLFFLAEPAGNADMEAISKLATQTETFRLTDTVFWLHAPDGIGRSKLVAALSRRLGVRTTARNANTVGEIAKLCEEITS